MKRRDRLAIMAAILEAGREIAGATLTVPHETTVWDRACDIDQEVAELEEILKETVADDLD